MLQSLCLHCPSRTSDILVQRWTVPQRPKSPYDTAAKVAELTGPVEQTKTDAQQRHTHVFDCQSRVHCDFDSHRVFLGLIPNPTELRTDTHSPLPAPKRHIRPSIPMAPFRKGSQPPKQANIGFPTQHPLPPPHQPVQQAHKPPAQAAPQPP